MVAVMQRLVLGRCLYPARDRAYQQGSPLIASPYAREEAGTHRYNVGTDTRRAGRTPRGHRVADPAFDRQLKLERSRCTCRKSKEEQRFCIIEFGTTLPQLKLKRQQSWLHLCKPSIDKQLRSRDVTAVVRCEKQHGLGNLIGCSHPAKRNKAGNHLPPFFARF